MDATQISLNISTVAAIVVALIVATRNITASATRVQVSNEMLDKRLIAVTAALEELPVIKQRLGTLENLNSDLHRKVFSDFPKAHAAMAADLAVLKNRADSTDRFKSIRTGSKPDHGDNK